MIKKVFIICILFTVAFKYSLGISDQCIQCLIDNKEKLNKKDKAYIDHIIKVVNSILTNLAANRNNRILEQKSGLLRQTIGQIAKKNINLNTSDCFVNQYSDDLIQFKEFFGIDQILGNRFCQKDNISPKIICLKNNWVDEISECSNETKIFPSRICVRFGKDQKCQKYDNFYPEVDCSSSGTLIDGGKMCLASNVSEVTVGCTKYQKIEDTDKYACKEKEVVNDKNGRYWKCTLSTIEGCQQYERVKLVSNQQGGLKTQRTFVVKDGRILKKDSKKNKLKDQAECNYHSFQASKEALEIAKNCIMQGDF